MIQLEFDYDALPPDQQRAYLKAAQRLLDGVDEGDGYCEVCRLDAPDHAADCPLRPDEAQAGA